MSQANDHHSDTARDSVDDDFARTLADARNYRADTSRAELGFGTRLTANIAELRRDGNTPGRSIWDEALAWLWGGAAGAAPVVAGLAIWFVIANGLNPHLSLDSGFDGLFTHLSSYLPFGGGH